MILLNNNKCYSEAHHIKPLGIPHNGPNIAKNIIVLCPNHHVMLGYGILKLQEKDIKEHENHRIDNKFLEYHNKNIF